MSAERKLADALDRLRLRDHEMSLLRAQIEAQKRVSRYTLIMTMSLLAAVVYCGATTFYARGRGKAISPATHAARLTGSEGEGSEGESMEVGDVEDCDLIVHYDSKYGAGVYAGRNFTAQEVFQTMVGVPVRYTHLEGTIFDDFGEGCVIFRIQPIQCHLTRAGMRSCNVFQAQ